MKSSQLPQGLLEALPDAALMVDREGLVEEANGLARTLFGDDLESLRLKDVLERGGAIAKRDYEVREAVTSEGLRLVTLRDVTERAAHRRTASQLADAGRIARLGVWDWNVASGEVRWSDEMFRLFGYEPGEVVPTYELWLEGVHPDDRERCNTFVQHAFETKVPYDFIHRVLRPDGSVTHLHCRGVVETDEDGNPTRVAGASQDISQQMAQEEALARMADQREAILDAAGEGICGVGADGRTTFANPAAARMLGLTIGELGGRPLAHFVDHDDDGDPFVAAMRSGEPVAESDVTFTRADGSAFPAEYICVPLHADGEIAGSVVTFNDATERKRFEWQLRFLADHDALTGLFNRRRLEEELAAQVRYAKRYGVSLAVLMIDLDNFKDVNDTRGHRVGDEVIAAVARVVEDRLRETDVLARLGGDEFAAVLPTSGPTDAVRVAEDLRATIRSTPIPAGQQVLRVTASIGLAVFGWGSDTPEQLLVGADIAMYDAKDAGRDRVALYSHARGDRKQIEARFAWTGRIRWALDSDGFVLHAQPILDVTAGGVSQHELLLRMRTKEGGLVPPGAFLPTAERHGLIHEIDRWVVTRSLELAAAGNDDRRLHVNVSGRCVGDADFPAYIADELERTGADPAQIVFEVTETAAIDSLHDARTFATRLAELGCAFALDDFGAGFSSFVYLKHLPIEYVKIDGDFIRGLAESPADQVVVRALVAIARGLGKKTVAEFVEDPATAALLETYGVDYLQGFYVGRPAPADEVLSPAAPEPA